MTAPKKALLALDFGTKTGWASGFPGCVVSGRIDLSPKRHEGGGMRYLRFRRHLDEIHAATPIGEVAYEEVRRHIGTDAAHVYGGLLAQLTAWCEEHGIPYKGEPVGTIKRFATGKGNASKDEVIASVRSWGYSPLDDNEADAIAIWHLRQSQNPVNLLA